MPCRSSRGGPSIGRIGHEPSDGVERVGGRFVATSTEPWLAVCGLPIEKLAGCFLEITYRASLWDEPARPIFRFWRAGGGFVDRIAAGAIVGAGIWTGRIPRDAVRLSVSPTTRLGRFDFAIETARPRAWPTLLAEGLRFQKKSTRSAILTRLIGWGPESDVNLAWATGSTPLAAYTSWRARRDREVDLSGFERPRFAWAEATPIRLLIVGQDPAALRRTLSSLEAQVFPHWTALLVDAAEIDDPRVENASRTDVAAALRHDAAGALTGLLVAGDTLPAWALACLAEQAWRHPGCRLFYGDALHQEDTGTWTPVLKPGWSPRLQAARPYLGRPVFARDLAAWSDDALQAFLTDGVPPSGVLEVLTPGEVMPLRRIMIEAATAATTPTAPATAPAIAAPPVPAPSVAATAAIVIPTRDQPARLRRAIDSIRARSRSASYRIVVVDNGSVEPEAKALFALLRKDLDVVVMEWPGPFNFSAMCNEAAAAAADGEVLIFLNDDTEVLSEGWLDRLIAHALEPTTGAVGARLTYPDGRLQHVGVLVGMGESAGHFGALAPGDAPGWACRNEAVHEVSAVTGACLAVARDKFDVVGGFDAEHLPIELSDVDLCLKLNARGWQTIVDPAVHLMHEESVSRGGATLRRLDVYGGERAVFVERWRHVLRDDPTFHPGLSLYSWRAALG